MRADQSLAGWKQTFAKRDNNAIEDDEEPLAAGGDDEGEEDVEDDDDDTDEEDETYIDPSLGEDIDLYNEYDELGVLDLTF